MHPLFIFGAAASHLKAAASAKCVAKILTSMSLPVVPEGHSSDDDAAEKPAGVAQTQTIQKKSDQGSKPSGAADDSIDGGSSNPAQSLGSEPTEEGSTTQAVNPTPSKGRYTIKRD